MILKRVLKTTYIVVKGVAVGLPVITVSYHACKTCFGGSFSWSKNCYDLCCYVPLIAGGSLCSVLAPAIIGGKALNSLYGAGKIAYQVASSPTLVPAIALDRIAAPLEYLAFAPAPSKPAGCGFLPPARCCCDPLPGRQRKTG